VVRSLILVPAVTTTASFDAEPVKAMLTAREKGATMEDIAETLRLTYQAIYWAEHAGPGLGITPALRRQ
jgi:hypothetical protein